MAGQQRERGTPAGVPVSADAAEVAAELVRSVRDATADLPFGVEAPTFLAALEGLAADEEPA
jgi:hypothetical protein